MKKLKLLLLTLLIPFVGFTQCPPGNVDIVINIETDNWPAETYWMVFAHQYPGISAGDTIAQVSAGYYTSPNTNYYDTICLPPMQNYAVLLRDTYGDGGATINVIECGTDTAWSFSGPYTTGYYTTLGWPTCGPGLPLGCTDSTAQNYNPNAYLDDGSCTYLPCTGLDTLWGETYCIGANVKLHYHWTNMANPSCRMLAISKSSSTYSLGTNWYPYPSNWSNQGIQYSNQQPNTTYYFLGMLADSSYTDTIIVTTTECNVGCTNPAALNYNPWANIDDGSCQMPPANCANGESNIVVTVIPDTYPGETSWTITDTFGTVLAGDSNYVTTGVPVITEVCIADGTVINFNLYDAFGDGMCGTCYGGVDGTALVQTLCGDTILSILPGNANFGTDTTVTYTVAPCTPNSIPGCMDPGYTEYNPQANVNDSSCATPVVLGCIDITSPDYDSLANTMSIIPNCNYTLVLTDGASDGWFGSWIGLLQDTTALGPYTMGPNDGASVSFTISLSSMSPVEAMFFAPGNCFNNSKPMWILFNRS